MNLTCRATPCTAPTTPRTSSSRMRPIEAIPANKQAIAVDDWRGKTEWELTMYLSLVQLLQRLPGAAGDCQVSALLLHE